MWRDVPVTSALSQADMQTPDACWPASQTDMLQIYWETLSPTMEVASNRGKAHNIHFGTPLMGTCHVSEAEAAPEH